MNSSSQQRYRFSSFRVFVRSLSTDTNWGFYDNNIFSGSLCQEFLSQRETPQFLRNKLYINLTRHRFSSTVEFWGRNFWKLLNILKMTKYLGNFQETSYTKFNETSILVDLEIFLGFSLLKITKYLGNFSHRDATLDRWHAKHLVHSVDEWSGMSLFETLFLQRHCLRQGLRHESELPLTFSLQLTSGRATNREPRETTRVSQEWHSLCALLNAYARVARSRGDRLYPTLISRYDSSQSWPFRRLCVSRGSPRRGLCSFFSARRKGTNMPRIHAPQREEGCCVFFARPLSCIV